MGTLTSQAQLALWRRRYRYRDAKLRGYKATAQHATGAKLGTALAGVHKWGFLLTQTVAPIRALEQKIAAQKPAKLVDWMPGAEHRPRASSGGFVSGFAAKCLWHTTDGMSDATSTLDANHDWPHFEVDRDGHVVQYVPVSLASSSLVHSRSPETNHGNVIQTEVVGMETGIWPAAQIAAVRRLARFIEAQRGVERACHVKFHPVGGVRLEDSAWVALKGHCGHMHVPENDHTDPGPIDTTGVLAQILS